MAQGAIVINSVVLPGKNDLLLRTGEGQSECLSHWSLKSLLLQEVSIDRLRSPRAMLLDVIKRNSCLETE